MCYNPRIMPFQFFAWASSLLSGFSIIGTKVTSRFLTKNPTHLNVTLVGVMTVWMVAISLYFGITPPTHFAPILIAGLLSGAVSIFFTYSIYSLDVTVLAPLFSFRTLFGLLFGALLLHESITRDQYVYILLIFAAGFFVSYDARLKLKSFFQKGVLYALAMTALLGLFGVFLQRAILENGFWTTTFFMSIVVFCTVMPTLFFTKERYTLPKATLYAAIAITFLDTLARLAASRAYAENYTISQAIVSLPFSMFFAFILARWRPGLVEENKLSVYVIRFIAGGVMIWAAIQLS